MVVVPGSEGNFGVLPGHAPLISTIRPGTIDIYEGRAITERIFVVGGIAEVTPERCTVLADEAMAPDSLDRAALDAELTDVEGNLPSLREQVARATGTERERLARRAAPPRTPASRRPRQAPGPRRNLALNRNILTLFPPTTPIDRLRFVSLGRCPRTHDTEGGLPKGKAQCALLWVHLIGAGVP